MTFVDIKDHILKVMCHYLYFGLRYKDDTKRDNNFQKTDRDTLVRHGTVCRPKTLVNKIWLKY